MTTTTKKETTVAPVVGQAVARQNRPRQNLTRVNLSPLLNLLPLRRNRHRPHPPRPATAPRLQHQNRLVQLRAATTAATRPPPPVNPTNSSRSHSQPTTANGHCTARPTWCGIRRSRRRLTIGLSSACLSTVVGSLLAAARICTSVLRRETSIPRGLRKTLGGEYCVRPLSTGTDTRDPCLLHQGSFAAGP